MIYSLLLAPSLAYIGPGAGLSMIGTLLAVAAVILFALLAPVIYLFQFMWSLTRRQMKADDEKLG